MNIELINTGTELLLGAVLNTHQQWLGRQLAELGRRVTRQVTVPDSASAIRQAVQEALSRADLVLVTGGLGPTSDDLTREEIAALLGRKLQSDAGIAARIEGFFAASHRPMPDQVRVQAMVPEGATVLTNEHGTAPGLALLIEPNPFRPAGGRSLLILLPGPPRELRPMFQNQVLRLVEQIFPDVEPFATRTLRTTGLGESRVEERISVPLQPHLAAGLEVGYCARPGEVDVRLIARGPEASTTVKTAEQIVRQQLGSAIFGEGQETLEAVVVRRLIERGQTLVVAESCTGGQLGHRVTNVPGASAVFRGGVIAYSNQTKLHLLGVQAGTLATHGAVSEATAREMAEGVRRIGSADFALAITGIAGPGGGSADKPVGTAFIGLASAGATRVERQCNPYDRETFKWVTSQQALDLLRRALGAQARAGN
ncbi:MAG: competence/damage-inducible protein A [Verrucomicrobia bacterium]|nr:competence/damage-inducible protein A [Verrucomicrobiota bacterium]